MGSGLLYGGIGVLWLVVLGQRWLHRRTLVRAQRSAPASSRQRIIEPRSDRRTRSATVLAMTAVTDRRSARAVDRAPGRVAAESTSADPPAVAAFEPVAVAARRSRAVRRRRRVLLALLVLTAGSVALAALARVPSWAPIAAAAATGCWFVSGASFARAGRRARRGHRRRVRNRELAREVREVPGAAPVPGPLPAAAGPPTGQVRRARPVEPSWDSVPAVDVVARWGREHSDTDSVSRRELAAAGLGAAAPDGAGALDGAGAPHGGEAPAGAEAPAGGEAPHGPGGQVPDPASWQPVPVPLPSYLTAPRVPRTVARIDFGLSGSWTSAVSGAPGVGDGAGDGRGPVQLGRPVVEGGPDRRPEPRPRRAAAAGPRQEVEGARVGDEQTAEVSYELPQAVGD